MHLKKRNVIKPSSLGPIILQEPLHGSIWDVLLFKIIQKLSFWVVKETDLGGHSLRNAWIASKMSHTDIKTPIVLPLPLFSVKANSPSFSRTNSRIKLFPNNVCNSEVLEGPQETWFENVRQKKYPPIRWPIERFLDRFGSQHPGYPPGSTAVGRKGSQRNRESLRTGTRATSLWCGGILKPVVRRRWIPGMLSDLSIRYTRGF